jgi:hypothetical protein
MAAAHASCSSDSAGNGEPDASVVPDATVAADGGKDTGTLGDGPAGDVVVGDAADGGGVLEEDAAPAPGVISFDKSLSQFELEPAIALAPNGALAAAWFGDPRKDLKEVTVAHVAASFSFDNGATWSKPAGPTVAQERISADPVLVPKADNGFLLVYLAYRRDSAGVVSDIAVYGSKIAPGATTFGTDVRISSPTDADPNFDKPWATVAPDGTTVVGYARTKPNAKKQILAAYSADDVTWTQTTMSPADVKSKQHVVFCESRGTTRLYGAYTVDSATIQLTWSDDGGRTWVTAANDANGVVVNDAGEIANHNQVSCFVVGTRVYLLYGVSSGELPGFGDNTRTKNIRLARLDASGAKPVVVGRDTVPMATTHALYPTLAVGAGNRLNVVYYAGSAASVDPSGVTVYTHAALPDGGAATALTFSAPTVVQDPTVIQRRRGTRDWLGDYLGAAASASTVHMAVVSNATGWSHIAYRKVQY